MKNFLRTSSSIWIDTSKIQSISYIEINHSLGFFMENGDSYQISLSSEITKETIEKYMPFLIHYCFARKSLTIDIYEHTKNGFLSSDKALCMSIYQFLLHSVFDLIASSGITYPEDSLTVDNNEILLSENTDQKKELLYLVKFRHSRIAISISINKDMCKERKESLIKALERFSDNFNELDLKVATVTYRD